MLDPLTAMAMTGGANLIGGERANRENRAIATQNRDFQYQMSNTAHQREVTDLRLAGLNPILSAKLGGASTPPGASATMSNTLGPATNSAMSAVRLRQDLENLKATNALIHAQIGNTNATTAKAVADTSVANSVEKLNTIGANIATNKSAMSDVARKGVDVLDAGANAIQQGATWLGETAAKTKIGFDKFMEKLKLPGAIDRFFSPKPKSSGSTGHW